jgi:hypothetical protein
MLRRLSSSIPRQIKPIVRRYSDGKPFYQSEGYKFGAAVTAVTGYLLTFDYGCVQSYRVDPNSVLKSGLSHSIVFGTIIGLPVAATWPVSVPILAVLGVIDSKRPA